VEEAAVAAAEEAAAGAADIAFREKKGENSAMAKNLSVYLSYLLRHHPEEAGLDMDIHGWVDVGQLIEGVNGHSRYHLEREQLERIVMEDEKGRYRFNEEHSRIKCCQGHSIPWVMPELTYGEPPEYLYHGTTAEALKKIEADGAIRKMQRHAVHLQLIEAKAWQSAERWHRTPVVLKIHAGAMAADGCVFGVADNGVWCTESVPIKYICQRIFHRGMA